MADRRIDHLAQLRWASVVMAPLALLGLACTGDDRPRDVSTPAPQIPVSVTLDDYRFTPAVLELAGVRRIRVRNDGGLEHSWTVLAEPIESETDLATAEVLADVRLEIGQVGDVDLSDMASGRYQVVCVIPGHLALGMVGELVVDDADVSDLDS